MRKLAIALTILLVISLSGCAAIKDRLGFTGQWVDDTRTAITVAYTVVQTICSMNYDFLNADRCSKADDAYIEAMELLSSYEKVRDSDVKDQIKVALDEMRNHAREIETIVATYK